MKVLLGFALAVAIMLIALATRRYLAWRDSRLTKIRIRERLSEVETDELLDELSTRNDLNEKRQQR
jgi:hypothetical protein